MDNDRLIGDCIIRACCLQDHAEALASDDFPGDEPSLLAGAIGSLAEALREHLILVRYHENYSSTNASQLIKIIDGLLKWLFEPLRFVDGAETQKVPWSLVGPLQAFSEQIVPDVMLLVRPKWRYNYAVVLSDLLADIRKALNYALSPKQVDECLSRLPRRVHVISFPFLERRSVLLHAALVHEIGHLVIQDYLVSEKQPIPAELRKEIIKSVVADTSGIPLYPLKNAGEARVKEILRRLTECAEYRKRAVQEIGSDLVALYLLGPAALFALYGIIGAGSPDKPPTVENRRYPPRRLRLRVCLEEIDAHVRGFTDMAHLEAALPPEHKPLLEGYRTMLQEIRALVKPQSDQTTLKKDPVVDAAYRWLRVSLPSLSAFVRERCAGKTAILPAKGLSEEEQEGNGRQLPGCGFLKEVFALAGERLSRDLPPNALDDTADPPCPAGFETILNAGWVSLLSGPRLPSSKDTMPKFVDWRRRVERLTLRGLELANLQRVYIRKWHNGGSR